MTIDNRIRFPATRIDFANDVGVTGQSHDSYPAPGAQARFDWMRMFLVGLLSNQSSSSLPTQYRLGTIWFNLTDETLKLRRSGGWESIAAGIKLDDASTSAVPYTLQDWYDDIHETVHSLRSELFFHGIVQSANAVLIPIPTHLQPMVQYGSRPFVWVNGMLINPAKVSLEPGANPTAIRMPSGVMPQGAEIVVAIKFIADSQFNTPQVTI